MKILITGNGFDLAHGLPTSYAHFMTTLNKINNVNLSNIPANYYNYFDSNTFFNEQSIDPNLCIFDINLIVNIKKRLDNKWFTYFKSQFDIDTWIDFENTLEDTLKAMYNQINYFKTNLFDKKDFLVDDDFGHETLGKKSLIRNILIDFNLISLTRAGYGYFFNKDFCRVNNNTVLSFNESKYFNYILSELEEFIDLFDDYLIAFVKPLINLLDKNEKLNLDGIDDHFTFNYTNTFQSVFKSRTKTKFLHGKISDNDIKNNIVLGFNDVFESVNNMKNFIPFTKYYQKLVKETDYKFLNDLVVTKNSLLKIYFWGHSLDVSDKVYMEEAFKIIEDIDRGDIRIFYHDKKSRKNLYLNLINIFGGTQIVKMQKSNKLIFIQSTPKNINTELNVKEIYRPKRVSSGVFRTN